MNDIGLKADISARYKPFLDKVLENHPDVFWKIIRTAGRGHAGGLLWNSWSGKSGSQGQILKIVMDIYKDQVGL